MAEMNAHAQIDEWFWWRKALEAGTAVETEVGNPRSGFFKIRDRNPDRSLRWDAVSIWRENGQIMCARTGPRPAPTDPDEIDLLFSYCAATPITYELYQSIADGLPWPEDVGSVQADNHPEAPAHERAATKLKALREEAESWIKEIGRVETKDQANKAANFADAFAKIEKAATDKHREEKAPHLEAGRAVDAAWKPVIESAALMKSWSKKAAEAYLIAEKRRLAEEEAARKLAEAKAAEEAERLRKAAEAAGAPPVVLASPQAPWPPQAPEKAAAGTAGRRISVRTRTVTEIDDLRAFLNYLADMNATPPDLLAVCKTIAGKLLAAGVKAPGISQRTIEEVA